MEEQSRFEAAFRRRIANASRSLTNARSAGDHNVAQLHAARLEDAFDLALRFKLGDGVPHLAKIPRPRIALCRGQ